MKSAEIRQAFLDFFREKGHEIVPSAPMVVKNDPTLMFTNAGMNQFKDIFLGNSPVKYNRIADTQKCLRVSGKHNDLEEVGHDTYHHTMFEMLGNWSFGDYFKEEAIAWAWELLTDVLGIERDRLYVSVFGGDEEDGLPADGEAYKCWSKIVPENRILYGSRKDNFWEMGDTGPCGPCSEIHADMRTAEERQMVDGADLVNKDHPEVIEIWNLVFIEFNRKADGKLVQLPAKHIDTGMGFERLCRVLQGKKSNYDTDIFQPIIHKTEDLTGKKYGQSDNINVAMRVVADHLRAVSFAIADGQLPSNAGAGYVIRRILRRAVRYGYTFLDQQEPFIAALVPVLAEEMGHVFPELNRQQDLIVRVITEEEQSFQRTLSQGIRRFDTYVNDHQGRNIIEGSFAFELFDTYGFPVDLTQLMARELGWVVDMEGFNSGLKAQQERSRQAATRETGDWIVVKENGGSTDFIGYDQTEAEVKILRYRAVESKKKTIWEIVLDRTPFYAESGGQVGDTGTLSREGESIRIIDTVKENDLIVHQAEKEPGEPQAVYKATVNTELRRDTENNHSATHLLHFALRNVLGTHVEQKGSLVDAEHLRFDFSHYQKMTDEEIEKVEMMVNRAIRSNNPLSEHRSVPMKEAKSMGALAFFGEKYGEQVRVIRFGDSVELCGGTHVAATGQIGFFKIVSESAIAAGVRRIEAITGKKAEEYILEQERIMKELRGIFKSNRDILKGIQNMMQENDILQKEILKMKKEKAAGLAGELENELEAHGRFRILIRELDAGAEVVKDLVFGLTKKFSDVIAVIAYRENNKAFLTIGISTDIAGKDRLDAGQIIRQIAPDIQGGGGGQPHYATAGGRNPEGLSKALQHARSIILENV